MNNPIHYWQDIGYGESPLLFSWGSCEINTSGPPMNTCWPLLQGNITFHANREREKQKKKKKKQTVGREAEEDRKKNKTRTMIMWVQLCHEDWRKTNITTSTERDIWGEPQRRTKKKKMHTFHSISNIFYCSVLRRSMLIRRTLLTRSFLYTFVVKPVESKSPFSFFQCS